MLRLALTIVVLAMGLGPGASAAATLDRAVPGGWWFSQAGLSGELGFALVDDDRGRFWSEFQRLGGVDALGYPVSHRFGLDGFTVQATQRALLQWRPDTAAVQRVNVFDRLHELGQDTWLLNTRQTPLPRQFDESGRAWAQVVAGRLAVMDGFPAVRAAYDRAIGDPIEANGLPMSDVVDMGNHHALRAQRVVFQLWKEDVPWARAGQVTVALGGDIAKEAGLLPAAAVRPLAPELAASAPINTVQSVLPVATTAAAPGSAAPGSTPMTAASGPVGPSVTPTVEVPGSRGALPPGTTAPPPGLPSPPATVPLNGDPARFALAPTDVPGGRLVEEAVLDAAALAHGRRDALGYASRIAELGFVRGFRRLVVREGAPHHALVVGGQADLFRDPTAARASWQLDARRGWASPEPSARLDPVGANVVGEESIVLRVVSGESASRGYLVLFRRLNAIAHVYALSQMAPPTVDETVAIARAVDARMR